jgi:hypothetical protein
VGLKEDGRGLTDDGAEAEVGVHELPGDEVEAVEGGRGAGARRVGERLSVGADVLEGEEGSGKRSRVLEIRVAPILGIKQTWER